MFRAVVEIPKGDDRRRHFNYEKTEFIDFGPIKEKIPVNDGVMPIDYGFIEGTHTSEGDEVDALIISDKKLSVAQKISVYPIALLERNDGDHKVVVADTEIHDADWNNLENKNLILEYFGYGKEIEVFDDPERATRFIEEHQIRLNLPFLGIPKNPDVS